MYILFQVTPEMLNRAFQDAYRVCKNQDRISTSAKEKNWDLTINGNRVFILLSIRHHLSCLVFKLPVSQMYKKLKILKKKITKIKNRQ